MESSRPTMPTIEVLTYRRNKLHLRNEVIRLEQELNRSKKDSLENRVKIWADLVICRSLLLSVSNITPWVDDDVEFVNRFKNQVKKRIERRITLPNIHIIQ
jgi:hypothetical protein